MEVDGFFRTVSIPHCYVSVCTDPISFLFGLKIRSLNRGGTGVGMEQ